MIVKITFSLFIHKSIALVSSRLIALAISSAVAAGAINKCPAEVFEWVSFYQRGPALAWPGRSFPGGSFARERSLGGRLVKRSRTLSSLWGPPRRVEEEDVRA